MAFSPDKLKAPLTPYSHDNITKKQLNKSALAALEQVDHRGKRLFVGIYAPSGDAFAKELQDIAKHVPYVDVFLLPDPKQKEWEVGKEPYLAGIDVFAFLPDAKQEGKTIAEIHRFGGVILAPESWKEQGVLTQYNPFTEVGDSFFYGEPHVWTMMAELVRIHEVFKFPYDWNRIRRNAMQNT